MGEGGEGEALVPGGGHGLQHHGARLRVQGRRAVHGEREQEGGGALQLCRQTGREVWGRSAHRLGLAAVALGRSPSCPPPLARDVVVSGSSDRCLRLWGRVSGVRAGEVEVVGTIHSLRVLDTRVFAASTNRTITVIDMLQLRVLARCIGHLNPWRLDLFFNNLLLSPSRTLFAYQHGI